MPITGQPNFPQSQTPPAPQSDEAMRSPESDVVADVPTQVDVPKQVDQAAVEPVSVPTVPVEQFYETKLFRVLVARAPWVKGHVIIERKGNDPHLYSFSPDDMDEFGYLLKKVSFWVMRLTGAPGFSVLMNDGTVEVGEHDPLRVHVVPRGLESDSLAQVLQTMQATAQPLEEGTVQQLVREMQNLMQMPQE